MAPLLHSIGPETICLWLMPGVFEESKTYHRFLTHFSKNPAVAPGPGR
jgi:hypothetical protein